MLTALLALLVGFGMFALGYVEPEMWSVAVLVIFVALVGCAVRAGDWLRWWWH